jgi:hypothetical protein
MTAAGEADHLPIVRPYARTAGRTRASLNLPLEALLITTALGSSRGHDGHPDHREIAVLCQDVRSVAEVAALLSIPLGVARVLIADMAGMGLLTVYNSAPPATGRPELALLERVLTGLRRI